ncbi:unnamed protein product [Diatraea saccharalis]|uniref:Phospholipase A2 n=1 Tax=Diatraea saccharalis TaxID=40085 RepID=A0A9P0C9V3_9NEOP|nr:unnamed protein product [Diatraea saccharalis]
MESLSLVLVLYVVMYLLVSCSAWAFTDVNYEDLLPLVGDNDDASVTDNERLLKFNLIYPGTKWCGAGNIAENYDDLGSEVETDRCCRAHDNCPDVIAAGETKYNLTNTAFYTRLSCDCDETFRQCLRSANTSVSKQIGHIYFNTLGTKCFRRDYPITGCSKRGG